MRRIQESTLLIFATFALSSCASLQTETAHEANFDFTKWTSYAFAKNLRPTVAAGAHGTQPALLIAKRNLERLLVEKGYRRAARANAHFEIQIHSGTWAKPRFGPENNGIEGCLTLRFVDRASSEVAWEGHAQETWLSNLDSEEEIRALRKGPEFSQER